MIPLRLGLVLVLLFASAACQTTYELPEQVHRRTATGLESVTVRQLAGSIRVLVAPVEDVEVRAHPRIRARSRSQAEQVLAEHELLFVREGSALTIHWSQPPDLPMSFAADLDISLPAGLALGIQSGVGDVEVRGLESPLKVTVSVGDVSVVGQRSPRIEATVDIGDIWLDADPICVQLATDIGDVEAHLGSELQQAQMTTDIGDVVLCVPEGVTLSSVSARCGLGEQVLPSRLAGDEPGGSGSPRLELESSIGNVVVRRSARSSRQSRFD